MTFLDAARHILSQANEPLSAAEIVRRATEQGILETKGKTPAQTLYTSFLGVVRRDGENAEFVLVSKGKWGLRAWAVPKQSAAPVATEDNAAHKPAYWFLTTNPRIYDVEEVLRKGRETWGQVLKGTLARKRIREDVREGDVAIVYRGRPSAEVVCEVRVSSPPRIEGGRPVFEVEPTRRIDPPVPLHRLRGCADLAGMEFLRNPQVSVSRLTEAEYTAIQRLIAEPTQPSQDYTHDQIQWYLIAIGLANDCSVWVAPDCRRHHWESEVFGDHCLAELPKLGLDDETVSLIQSIDVLWLRKSRIVGAFEIEHTTSIYSALLRFADLVALQPNTRIDSYVVAHADRRSAVVSQVNRPAFSRFETPLGDVCRFIPYDRLADVYETAKKWGGSLRVDIGRIAEDCRRTPETTG